MQANDAEGRKNDRLKKEERENLISQPRWALLFTGKKGFLPELQGRQGKFWLGARNIIRAKARYIPPPLRKRGKIPSYFLVISMISLKLHLS